VASQAQNIYSSLLQNRLNFFNPEKNDPKTKNDTKYQRYFLATFIVVRGKGVSVAETPRI
jgi:hypothetical protein